MLSLLTLNEVEERAKRHGVTVASRTLWEYVHAKLLPQGNKIPGRGNVLYYPEYAVERLVQVYWLNKKMGVPISVLKRSSDFLEEDDWASSNVSRHPSPLDVVVTCAGLMANMGIVHKTRLGDEDLATLLQRVKTMFEKWVNHRSSDSQHSNRLNSKERYEL
jgi:hypothetical protein